MRLVLAVLVVVAAILAFVLVRDDVKESHGRAPTAKAKAEEAPVAQPERRMARVQAHAETSAQAAAPQPSNRAADAGVPVAAEKEKPKGPFTVSLGTHTVHFRQDPGFAVRMKVLLTVPTQVTRMEVLRQRRKLVRMLFFLGANRRADGTRGSAGRDRFIRDLSTRYGNVIRSGLINRIDLKDYEVIKVNRPDAGAP